MIVNQAITLADELDSDGDLEVTFYDSDCDYAVLHWWDRDEAQMLVEHLNKLFDLGSAAIAVARDEAYREAKAHIQFPLCACNFSDDEETILSPCATHAAWKKEEKDKC